MIFQLFPASSSTRCIPVNDEVAGYAYGIGNSTRLVKGIIDDSTDFRALSNEPSQV